MFTFKKFAAVGVAAFVALSMSSCSDDPADDPPPPSFDVGEGEAALGGVNNSEYGSSLDIDANKVYKISAVTASVANDIDIIFDGTNVYTPNSIKVSTAASVSELKGKYTNSTSTALIFPVSSSTTTDDGLRDDFAEYEGEDTIISNTSKGKKFGVLTSTGDALALVTVKEKEGESILVTLLIVK